MPNPFPGNAAISIRPLPRPLAVRPLAASPVRLHRLLPIINVPRINRATCRGSAGSPMKDESLERISLQWSGGPRAACGCGGSMGNGIDHNGIRVVREKRSSPRRSLNREPTTNPPSMTLATPLATRASIFSIVAAICERRAFIYESRPSVQREARDGWKEQSHRPRHELRTGAATVGKSGLELHDRVWLNSDAICEKASARRSKGVMQ